MLVAKVPFFELTAKYTDAVGYMILNVIVGSVAVPTMASTFLELTHIGLIVARSNKVSVTREAMQIFRVLYVFVINL